MARVMSYFSQDLLDEILEKLSDVGHLVPLLKSDERYPSYMTFMKWVIPGTPNGHAYDAALHMFASKLAFEQIDISRNLELDPRIMAHQLNVNQWLAERMSKRAWGKSETINHQLDNEKPLHLTDAQLIATARPLLESDERTSGSD